MLGRRGLPGGGDGGAGGPPRGGGGTDGEQHPQAVRATVALPARVLMEGLVLPSCRLTRPLVLRNRKMFEAFAHFHAVRQSLQEAYVHPADVSAPSRARTRVCRLAATADCAPAAQEGYIGADQNWEYLNRFVQPVSFPQPPAATTAWRGDARKQ